ncbi:MAG: hypothetical protein JNM79_18100 [Burkholderiales bacterium]|nr:hypothetical protein [Burkholderiales bacterium]
MSLSPLFAAGASPPLSADAAADDHAQSLEWLPRARWARVALVVVLASTLGLTFAAWLSPNMVFEFANLVFCG